MQQNFEMSKKNETESLLTIKNNFILSLGNGEIFLYALKFVITENCGITSLYWSVGETSGKLRISMWWMALNLQN